MGKGRKKIDEEVMDKHHSNLMRNNALYLAQLVLPYDAFNSTQQQNLRFYYLHEYWGVEQSVIAEWFQLSQPTVSRKLSEARKYLSEHGLNQIKFMERSIKESASYLAYVLMGLPREIMTDLQVYSFLTYILGLDFTHTFFRECMTSQAQNKIRALHDLGIRNKAIEKAFNRSQGNVSMALKRSDDSHKRIERSYRYKFESPKDFVLIKSEDAPTFRKLLLAGGQDND